MKRSFPLPSSVAARPRSGSPARLFRTLLLLLLGLQAAAPALAAGSTPAQPVPLDRWGVPQVMRPWTILGDSTNYDGSFIPRADTPVWFDADLAGHFLFTATGKGLMVHDLSTDPQSPKEVGYSYGFDVAPKWFQSDLKFYIFSVSAPDDDPDVAVTIGAGEGVLIWDFSKRANPTVHYQNYTDAGTQDGGVYAGGVWAAGIGQKHYAFTANGQNLVNVWDLDNAAKYNRCDSASGNCNDVWLGKVALGGTEAKSVDGAGNFLAVAEGRAGLEIWNVANPRSPARVLSGTLGGNTTTVAMWQSGTRYYAATLEGSQVNGQYWTSIWDVSCIATASCGSSALSQPVAQLPSNGYFMSTLTVSQSDGRTFLYVGHLDRFASGDQREFLWDVTSPQTMSTSIAGPNELTPDNPAGKGYWGWYYSRNSTGFQNVAPMSAVVVNGYVYRAAWTVLDVHELLGAAPPVADFDWSPKPVYQGQTVTLTDQSGGAPDSWLWLFSGATPSQTQSTIQSPSLSFGAVGTASVTLSAANGAGAGDPVTKTFQVNDPKPLVQGVSASTSSALVCQAITFTADGVTGRPPLAYAWVVKDGGGAQVASGGNSATFAWNTADSDPVTAGDQPYAAGDYTAEVTVTNTAGTAVKASAPIHISDPPTLAISAGPSTDPFNFGTVQFHASTMGAATWTWDYGDGTSETFTTQSEGENPVHNYTTVGTYTVTLRVDNCIEPALPKTLSVTVTKIDPLKVNAFQAISQCQIGGQGGGCFTAGKAVSFSESISGSPDSYEYDWDGNNTWSPPSSTPILSHTYTQPATNFVPKIRITRGTEPQVVVANGCTSDQTSCTGTSISVSPAAPPSIVISGPSSGSVGQSLRFSVSDFNNTGCVVAGGWSWKQDGAALPDTGSAITTSFSTAGSHSLTAQNSGCGTASKTKFVSITSSGGGGTPPPPPPSGKPKAGFTYSPAAPKAGAPVSFDSSSSTGSPTSWYWTFGDGGSATGEKVSHAFAAPGTYAVKLSVSAPGDCKSQVGGLNGICTDDVTKNVVVGANNAVIARFDDDAGCTAQVGGGFCEVETGQEVTFTDQSDGKVSQRTWDFGDGANASGPQVTHSWSEPGRFTVTLEVQNADSQSSASKTYFVSGPPTPATRAVVVPWLAQADADKALAQASDLYVNNPTGDAMDVTITFRHQGLPEPDPPQVTETIAPDATLYLPDVLATLQRSNVKGFLYIEPAAGSGTPVVTSFNRTFQGDGRSYGQVVPGMPLGGLQPSAQGTGTPKVFHLVGLNDTSDRLAYFGVNNPSSDSLHYDLRFFDALGNEVGHTDTPEGVAPFGQKVYQVEAIRDAFHIADLGDYRVEIEPTEGSAEPLPFGANLRLSTKDPSFVRSGKTSSSDVYLVGALNTPGLNGSVFQTDLVLGNPADAAATCDVTFTPTGILSEPTAPQEVTLQPRSTVRLANVVAGWDVGNSVGVLAIHCDGNGGVFPVAQGESYDVSNPSQLYGQFMPALTADDAAEPGKPLTLAGLRQDEEFRTTLWLYNPGDDTATYNVHYFDLQGNEIGGEDAVRAGAGKFRQINPGAHPLPDGSIADGFTVRIEVTSGKLLAAGQVVNSFNDPAYIVGQ